MHIKLMWVETGREIHWPLQRLLRELPQGSIDVELELMRGESPIVTLADGERVRVSNLPDVSEQLPALVPQMVEMDGYLMLRIPTQVVCRAATFTEAQRMTVDVLSGSRRAPAEFRVYMHLDDLFTQIEAAVESGEPPDVATSFEAENCRFVEHVQPALEAA